jgi:protein gp37
MSDLFQPEVPDAYIKDVVRVMVEANWHVYQVLTKRSERLRDMLSGSLRFAGEHSHIWWGVSVEDRRFGVPRIEHLLNAKVAMKFLSIEPLLEDLGDINISGVNWVIVGGESGPGARVMRKAWVERIFKLCRRNKIPFFFKQWGGVHKSSAGRKLNGRTYDEMPSVSTTAIPTRAFRVSASHEWQANAKRWIYERRTHECHDRSEAVVHDNRPELCSILL